MRETSFYSQQHKYTVVFLTMLKIMSKFPAAALFVIVVNFLGTDH